MDYIKTKKMHTASTIGAKPEHTKTYIPTFTQYGMQWLMPKNMDINISTLWIADTSMRELESQDLYFNLVENNMLHVDGISLTGIGLIGLLLSFMNRNEEINPS